jgi:hypothetical protein
VQSAGQAGISTWKLPQSLLPRAPRTVSHGPPAAENSAQTKMAESIGAGARQYPLSLVNSRLATSLLTIAAARFL